MSITRWDPSSEMVSLRDAVDRLVSESFVRPIAESGRATAASLSLDVREEGDDYVVSAAVPGVSPDDVEITVLGDMIRIRGERREERKRGGEGERWIVREQRFGAFERSVRLPSPVRAAAADAEFKDGILTVRLPKTEEAKERRIAIRGSQRSGQAQDIPVESASRPADKTAGEPGIPSEAADGGRTDQSSQAGSQEGASGVVAP